MQFLSNKNITWVETHFQFWRKLLTEVIYKWFQIGSVPTFLSQSHDKDIYSKRKSKQRSGYHTHRWWQKSKYHHWYDRKLYGRTLWYSAQNNLLFLHNRHRSTMIPLQHTCPGCGKMIQFEESDLSAATFTDRFQTFQLDYVVCPSCQAILPYRVLDAETGELHSQFTFNV